jgi:hypothetical protein
MENREVIKKLKAEVAEIELYDQMIPLGPKNNFMEHIEKIFELIEKIK